MKYTKNSQSNPPEQASGHMPTEGQDRRYRCLIYSHDTFGLGHLQRCLKIAQALTESISSLSIIIATGSSVVHRYEIPERVDYIKLPSVRKIGPEKYESRTLETSHQKIINLRASLLLETVKHFKPHFIITDHSPIGMKGEMKPALEWVRAHHSDCVTLLGLRDIIDDAESVKKLWTDENIYREIERLYDHINIYGDKSNYDMTTLCRFTDLMVSRTHFTGYIGDNRPGMPTETEARKRPRVVVSVGGGDGATEPVIATYLDMIREYADKIEFESCLIAGPFVPDDVFAKYQLTCQELAVELHRFVDSTTPYFQNADLVISTAGYNSVTQILQAADRAILIPRIMHRQEQYLRAVNLERAGLVWMIRPDKVTSKHLFQMVVGHLRESKRPVKQARESGKINLIGLEQIVRQFEALIAIEQTEKREHV